MKRPSPPRVALVGATASGKSAVALSAAAAVDGLELISVDAMQVYRGMDIGTAKPTPGERAAVRHRCIDLVEPSAEFTVADFQHAARAASQDCSGPALYVGGSGLYHRAVIDDLEIPGEFPEVRAELEAAPDTAALFGRLHDLDPAAALKMEPTNRRRIVRALEVTLGSGRRFSSYGPGLDAYPVSGVTQIGLCWDRARLATRVEARVDAMMRNGLLDEVRDLMTRPMGRTARQAIGYKELIAYLDGRCSLDDAVGQIVTATRQFAVRQEKWFRRDPRIRWISIESDPLSAVSAVVGALSA